MTSRFRVRACGLVAALAFTLAPGFQPALHASDKSEEAATAAGIIPVISLSGGIVERKAGVALFEDKAVTLRKLVATFDRAAADSSVKGLVIRFEGLGAGMAQVMELHNAIRRFRDTGKPVSIYLDDASVGGYMLASAATEIVIPPLGGLDLTGINVPMYFYKDLLKKLGVEADVVNTGKFKNAFEPFTHNAMSEGTRIQMTKLIEDIWDTIVANVSANRGITKDAAYDLLTQGPYTAQAALEAKAVDRVEYYPLFLKSLEAKHPGTKLETEYGAEPKKEPPSLMSLLMGNAAKAAEKGDSDPKIALVYALGGISDGRADKSNPFAEGEGIYGDDFVELLDDVIDDGGVKAVVLRVDSPGGSALASDKIWERLERIQADGIPVVACMGNVAASGGYYISMGADKIVAQPNTITGSIGVIGGKFALGGTYEKIGVKRQLLSIGDRGSLWNEATKWSAQDRKILNEMLENVYDEFTSKVAQGRKMEQADVKAIGGGRVWTGTAAKEIGLVDEIGGIDDAIAIARQLSGAGDAKVVEYPKAKDLNAILEEMFSFGASVASRSNLAATITANPVWQASEVLLPKQVMNHMMFVVSSMSGDRPKVMAVMPWSFEW